MEPAKNVENWTTDQGVQPGQIVPLSLRERGQDAISRDAGQKRDWSAALNLINECFEAVRAAEERATTAESRADQLLQRLDEQSKTMDARLSAANKRVEAADARTRESEAWLIRFHDAIVDGFQKTFVR